MGKNKRYLVLSIGYNKRAPGAPKITANVSSGARAREIADAQEKGGHPSIIRGYVPSKRKRSKRRR